MRFQGKVALITGGGTGIGAAVARRIVAEGGKVVLTGRRAEPLADVAGPLGEVAAISVGDASKADDAQAAVALAVERFGGLDVLIANAGGHGLGAVADTSDQTWADSLSANLNTAFVAARESLPRLIERQGNVVVVSSIAGLFAGPSVAGYTTTKHALIGLTRSIARDYGRVGVRANVVCPGWVATAMADEQMAPIQARFGLATVAEAYAKVTEDVPLGRPARPEDVASAICFLASTEASMISGATLTVDGGASTVDLPTVAFTK